jgi:CheY-like chemotaxis protein
VRLKQILLNLVSNAIKFAPNGTVTVHAEPVHRPDATRVRFRVRDTGIGIAPDFIPHLFKPFAQETSVSSRRYGGTGLGLPIVRELVERQAGMIEVESEPGHGSTFTVELPLQAAPATSDVPAGPGAAAPAASAPLAGVKVLLVEDNELNQIVTTRILQRAGAVVRVASSGEEALDLVQATRYDVVLMDIQLPGMDGFEATRRIREQLGDAAEFLPVAALTGSTAPGDAQHAEECGIAALIAKPADPTFLCHQLAALVRARRGDEGPKGRPSRQVPALDLATLNRTTMGEPGLALEMMDVYADQFPQDQTALRQAVLAADLQQLQLLAHRLKASAGFIGASVLESRLDALSAAAITLDVPSALNLANAAIAEIDRVLEELPRHRQAFASARHPEVVRGG